MTAQVRHRGNAPAHAAVRGSPSRLLHRKLRRDLRASWWQVVAVVLTVLLGVMLFAASYDAFRNLTASYQQTYDDLAFADLVVSGGDQAAFVRVARETAGVSDVTERLQADVPMAVPVAGGEHTLLGRLVAIPDGEPDVNRVEVLRGSGLDSGGLVPAEVLVEKHMADHFELAVGDRLTVVLADGPTDVTLRGVVASPEYLWPARDRQEVITTPDQFGVLFAPPGLVASAPPGAQVAQTLVRYDAGTDAAALDESLSAAARAAGASDVVTRDEQPSNAALDEDLSAFGELSFMFPALFLTGAGLAAFIMLNRLVHAQRGQVGVLLASGLDRRSVVRHYVEYGLLLGVAGAVAGVLLGMPLGAWITSTYTQLLSIPDTVVRWYWTTPLIGLAFGLLMGALAAWAPARSAVRVPPALTMRGEIPQQSPAGMSLAERLVPVLRRQPVRMRVALRGVGRHRTRSAATVVGVVLAIVLVLTSWAMIDTVDRLMAKQFDVVSTDDARLVLAQPLDAATLGAVGDVDGVAAAEPVLALQVGARAGGAVYGTQVQGFAADTGMHGFVGLDQQPRQLPPTGVLAGQALRDELSLQEGDSLVLSVPALSVEVSVPVQGFVDEPLGTYLYADREWLVGTLEQTGVDPEGLVSPTFSSVAVQVQPGSDRAEVLQRLQDEPFVAAVVSTTSLRDLFDEYFALFYAFVGVMLLFGGILAFALIFNMITAALAERGAELATMRASGMSVRQVTQMITVENVLLVVLGIPLGLFAGYVMAEAFMGSFSSDLFSFDLDMSPWTAVWTSLAVLGVALLSQVPGVRAVRRLDVATVVRQRSL